MKYFIFDMGGVLKRSIPYDLIKNEPSMINISNLSDEQIEKYDKYKIEMERGTYSTLDYLRDYSEFFNKKNICAFQITMNKSFLVNSCKGF